MAGLRHRGAAAGVVKCNFGVRPLQLLPKPSDDGLPGLVGKLHAIVDEGERARGLGPRAAVMNYKRVDNGLSRNNKNS